MTRNGGRRGQAFAQPPGLWMRAMVAINMRCLEGVDLDALPVTYYDGRSH
ncbi:hypothetical protein [Burkholderia cepacia]